MLAGLPTHSEDLPERMPQTVTNLSKPVLEEKLLDGKR